MPHSLSFKSVLLISAMMMAATVASSCGGGSDSSTNGAVSVTPPPPPPPQATLDGIAPLSGISGLGVVPFLNDQVEFSLKIRAFDEGSNDPVNISSLSDLAINITSSSGELTRWDITSVGRPNCTRSNSNLSSEAMLLFDRSGSISGNDPNEEMLEAGIAFTDILLSPDTAAISAFTGNIPNDIEFLTSGFTSDINALRTGIRSIRSPDGSTPLWSSIIKAIEDGGYPNLAQNKALVTFSDGENTSGNSSSGQALRVALDNNVTLYSVSLNNSESQALDRISLASGGLAWSTDEAKRVAIFTRSLSKVLDGDYIDCSVGVSAKATAQNYNQDDLIVGPGRVFKPNLLFNYDLSGQTGQAANSIIFPFTAGRVVGSTDQGNFSTADFRSAGNAGNCVQPLNNCSTFGGGRFTNVCSQAVTAKICSESGDCDSKTLSPKTSDPSFGVIFENVTGRFKKFVCPHTEVAGFEPIKIMGSSPNQTISSLNFSDTSFNCLYDQRIPAPDRSPDAFIVDGQCRVP